MITIKEYRTLIATYRYDGNGKFFHKVNGRSVIKGERAGYMGNRGYRVIGFKGKTYLEHRVVFFIHNGFLPNTVDHINNDSTDNRVDNLRACSSQQNSWNAKLSKSNNSGFKGVGWYTKSQKYRARLKMCGKDIHIGLFDDINDAVEAVRNKRETLHGQFCNHGVEA